MQVENSPFPSCVLHGERRSGWWGSSVHSIITCVKCIITSISFTEEKPTLPHHKISNRFFKTASIWSYPHLLIYSNKQYDPYKKQSVCAKHGIYSHQKDCCDTCTKFAKLKVVMPVCNVQMLLLVFPALLVSILSCLCASYVDDPLSRSLVLALRRSELLHSSI